MLPAMQILSLDHVQLAMPAGGEERARAFYVGLLGFVEEPKPPSLAKNGGAWFRAGSACVHLGVEAEFRPAQKAHPALVVRDLSRLAAHLERAGVGFVPDDRLPGVARGYVQDPFGNRIELLAESEGNSATRIATPTDPPTLRPHDEPRR